MASRLAGRAGRSPTLPSRRRLERRGLLKCIALGESRRTPERVTDQIPPWHFLNFLPLPQGHFELRPTLPASRTFTMSARPLWQVAQVHAAGWSSYQFGRFILLLLQDVERHDGIDHSRGRYLKGVEHLVVPENAREEVRPSHRVCRAAY